MIISRNMESKGNKWLMVLIPLLSGIVMTFVLISDSCKKDIDLPTVGMVMISDVTEDSFKGLTRISADGGSDVKERGLCWSTSPDPTTLNDRTTDGKGTGTFESEVTGLAPGTSYYVRAYATNRGGTAYGDMVSLHTWSGTMKDTEGNTYQTITIGSQEWMGENLRTKQLNDGILLDLIPSSLAITTPGYMFYLPAGTGNDPIIDKKVYGALYNGYAVLTDKLCPEGWHMPTYDDWYELVSYLGGYQVAGGKLKETGTSHWQSPNDGATNESGFTAIPGGYFGYLGGGCGGTGGPGCTGLGTNAFLWSSSQNVKDFTREDTVLYVAIISSDTSAVYPGSGMPVDGRSVRCIKNQ
jgi:uncharacterized protein (TIGR02145 family)